MDLRENARPLLRESPLLCALVVVQVRHNAGGTIRGSRGGAIGHIRSGLRNTNAPPKPLLGGADARAARGAILDRFQGVSGLGREEWGLRGAAGAQLALVSGTAHDPGTADLRGAARAQRALAVVRVGRGKLARL
eukprot:11423279-Alexandrium_andersonii.AAC.1